MSATVWDHSREEQGLGQVHKVGSKEVDGIMLLGHGVAS